MSPSNQSPIIRRQTSWVSRSLRGLVLIVLWAFIVLVVVTNLGFSLGWYNDTLVSLYLLFNLQAHANSAFLWLILGLLISTPLYCIGRWCYLKGGKSA
ncbi:hypothetical protein [Levilactobacillus suantsaii]|uniref:hypothetical protein n=1 Tax=Levilactobacillus suantsaii TaxID=2292255 RepID=UPI00100B7022|nr:hypothetical protein [Levilactobacillus suantsaii]QMU09035.1 hypothetical protein H3M12_05175 [Levilactobacillus suantsaii]